MGAHVVAPRVMYWGLRGWLRNFAEGWGIETDFVDATALDVLRTAMRPGRTRLVWIETPANPLWSITDIAGAAEIAHAAGALLAVDSTAATPVLTRPLRPRRRSRHALGDEIPEWAQRRDRRQPDHGAQG